MLPKAPYILAIETSCDETAVSALFGMQIKSHHVHSQAALHAEYGGVFPNLAKREHGKNIIPLLSLVLHDTCNLPVYAPAIDTTENITYTAHTTHATELITPAYISPSIVEKITAILHREQQALHDLYAYAHTLSEDQFNAIKSTYTAIAVTYGPGLEPALWVGISVAKALSVLFDLPLYPINHMEGHIASVLTAPATAQDSTPEATQNIKTNTNIKTVPRINFPAIALLISGGHTELVELTDWHHYRLLGKTVDDAVGEAYDKVARLIGLPYPGGPAISKVAQVYRDKQTHHVDVGVLDAKVCDGTTNVDKRFILPRPMLHTKDFNFSFSGLKTAVLYAVKKKYEELGVQELDQCHKEALAGEFEDAVVEVLVHKTKRAIEETSAKHLVIGGGVIANTYIRSRMADLCQSLDIALSIPEFELTTDNASMIGLVAYLQIQNDKKGLRSDMAEFDTLKADGNLSL